MSELTHASAPKRFIGGQLLGSSQLVLGVILAVLCIAISIAAPQFHSEANIIAILRQCALVLVVASGMTMLIITAEVDLSVGASLAFVGCIGMAVLNSTHSLALGMLAALAFAGGVGLFNGLVVTRLRVNSLIATIGTMMMLQGGVYLFTREAVQNHNQLASFTDLGAGYVGPVPVPVILAALIFVVAYVALRFTTLGRYLYAVGANEKAVRLSGVRSERLKLFAFVVTGLCVGVAGMILSSLMNAGQPTAGRGFELTVIAAVILGGTSLLGGRGSLFGTLLGVLVLKVIDNGIIILGWNQDLQMVVPGVVIILATYLDIIRNRANVR
ncbi:ABC transporter permease [Mesorhizobium sp. M00.F.Ca.ET.151.01.1.1]|uniref:ABC transporter permease n=1 Tax=unclassified Mesorhizobium TaxID=325217 RepID=UPI000FDC7C75|nr:MULTISPECIES: ABC transporter permease [unclassified Mesorhizobium]TGR43565.1 ABC transporter permease [bacterium M00.F.Ca.ET.199.01.1.1]TGU39912.1 ABC transporter permease [bacterium M00.F.Ca.ET.156.01.1.1]TGU99674.1 ABC transporter permease [Mesorhizobium sp. M00.F.Ca.ET.151.01.1.1]TGV86719.1 ABC transporter permease [Mesorhizobium sp. M00.F.Ca.ET.149.01.1.1]TGR27896.1 ABC transporter permease [Mesorhizobium sp. M8A.F.Ca.ET.197.01.1.1]